MVRSRKLSNKEQFKKLQEKWYKKLARSGFKDIEESEWKLKRYDSDYFSKKELITMESTSEYYTQCREFLKTHLFFSPMDKLIWRWHCRGITIEEISKYAGIPSTNVVKILKRLRGVMRWKQSQRKVSSK